MMGMSMTMMVIRTESFLVGSLQEYSTNTQNEAPLHALRGMSEQSRSIGHSTTGWIKAPHFIPNMKHFFFH